MKMKKESSKSGETNNERSDFYTDSRPPGATFATISFPLSLFLSLLLHRLYLVLPLFSLRPSYCLLLSPPLSLPVPLPPSPSLSLSCSFFICRTRSPFLSLAGFHHTQLHKLHSAFISSEKPSEAIWVYGFLNFFFFRINLCPMNTNTICAATNTPIHRFFASFLHCPDFRKLLFANISIGSEWGKFNIISS